MHIPTLPSPSDDPSTSSTSVPTSSLPPATSPSTSTSTDSTSTSTPPIPPFTPQTFSSYSSRLHVAHHAYLTRLSSALLDPIDQLLDNDVTILTTISRQLPLLRLDHHAKADALQGVERRDDKRGLEEAQREERESREVWETQMEVVDKLAREVSVKKGEVLRAVADAYVTCTRRWYEEMSAITADAVRPPRAEGGVEELRAEDKTVGEVMEAAVEVAAHRMGEVGEKLVNPLVTADK